MKKYLAVLACMSLLLAQVFEKEKVQSVKAKFVNKQTSCWIAMSYNVQFAV